MTTELKTLVFYGHSDDVFGYNVDDRCGDDHDDCARGLLRTYLIDAGADGRICVTGIYAPHGCWSIGLALLEDGDRLPAWLKGYDVHENGYSVTLTLKVPRSALVTLIHPTAEEDS